MMDTQRGSSPSKAGPSIDSPEQLLNAFKAAALSVTKLYKTSAAVQAKSRSDGYQDCLDDLLHFLDKRDIGLDDGEGWQIRKWATERLDGKDSGPQATDDEDDTDKTETASSPEPPRSNAPSQRPNQRAADPAAPISQTPVIVEPIIEEPPMITVPTHDTFTFQSSLPYPNFHPQESCLNLANLDLSDSIRTTDNTTPGPSSSIPQAPRMRRDKRGPRPRNGNTGHLGRGAGQKRPFNLADYNLPDLFDVSSVNFGKDSFGREGKRSRHT
ncbi:hypothetical protein F4777DRAFT_542977 [Nemania sp. FL0916]|nr:hypothetical protein F4777DRAFT_542977 [Nemania sp. FL0916]